MFENKRLDRFSGRGGAFKKGKKKTIEIPVNKRELNFLLNDVALEQSG
jgi:hypothetical protein